MARAYLNVVTSLDSHGHAPEIATTRIMDLFRTGGKEKYGQLLFLDLATVQCHWPIELSLG